MSTQFRALMLVSVALPGIAVAQTTTAPPNTDATLQAGTAQQTQTEPESAATTGVADIVVTAQRREESLQRVPVAVTAFGAAALAARGITGLASLTTQANPGIVVKPFAGAETTLSFNIRGISTPDPGSGLAEQGAAVYSDGVPLGRAVGTGIDLADVERIEVLRGPQGTLFGRNAEGGAVQFISKRPTGELGGRFEGQLGNYDARRALVHLDLPSFANISLKLSGLIDRRDGYVNNHELRPGDTLSPNEQHSLGFKNQKGFRVAALWRPSSRFDAYYSFDYSDLKFTNFYNFRTGGFTPAEPGFCAVPTFAAFCATPAGFVGNIYQNTYAPEPGRPTTSALPIYNPYNRNRIRGHGLTLTWQAADDLTFKSITGYRRLRETSLNNLSGSIAFVQFVPSTLFDGVAPDVPAGTQSGVSAPIATASVRQKQFSEELQAIGTVGRFEFTTGLFYYNEKLVDGRDSLFNYAEIYTGTPNQLATFAVEPFALAPSNQVFRAEANSYAAYGQATYTPAILDEKLKLTAGLRYTHDTKRFVRTVAASQPDNTLAPLTKSSRVDPAFIIAYQATGDLNVYGKYSQAYRAGGTAIRNKQALTTYGPEVNKTFEAGFKAQLFDRRVRWNLAAFRSRLYHNQISFQNSVTDPSSTDTINLNPDIIFAGSDVIRFEGVENEITIAPTRNLTLGINYSYTHAHGGPSLLRVAPGQPAVAQFFIINVPKHQLGLTLDHTLPLGSVLALTTHVDYNYSSDYHSNPVRFNFAREEKAELNVVNAKVGITGFDFGGAAFTLSAYGKNILQSHDFQYPFSVSTSDPTKVPAGGAGILAPPRTYGIELRASF